MPGGAAPWYNAAVSATTDAPRVGVNALLLSAAASYRSAGVSGYIRRLLTYLPEVAADLRLTAFVPDGDLRLKTDLDLRPVRGWDVQQPLRRILWEQWALPQHVRRLGLNLLHGPVSIAPLLAGCATVVTIHDLTFLAYPQAFPAAKRLYLRSLVGRSARSARRVIASSYATAQDVVRRLRVPPERVTVVHLGVDPEFTPAPAAEVEAFRRRRGLPQRFILHVGTLEPRKNLVRLVEAFSRLRRCADLADVRLVLAGGKGWGYDPVFAAVERLGLGQEVLFPGYVPDEELAWWYRAATVFAYPSLMEGFGLPVLEALACGAVVVTSAVSSMPEVAGDAALLVDPTDVDALADALQRALVDQELRAALRCRAVEQAQRFPWRRTVAQTAAVYRQVLGLPQPQGEEP